MRDSFFADVVLRDMPGGEAKWVAVFIVGGHRQESEPTALKPPAQEWLDRKVRTFLAEPAVIAAPDGDGVIVLSDPEANVVFWAPSVAVHVGRLSALGPAPVGAAQIAERVHYAHLLIEEAAQLAKHIGDHLPAATHYEGVLWGLEDALGMFLETVGCEVLTPEPVAAPEATERASHLRVLPGGVA